MSVYLPDNKITAPELWYPGRKPTVPVKVNWNHPLSDGLVCCLMVINGAVDEIALNAPLILGDDFSVTANGMTTNSSTDGFVKIPPGVIPQFTDALTVISNADIEENSAASWVVDGSSGNTENFRLFWDNTGYGARLRLFTDLAVNNLDALNFGPVEGLSDVTMAAKFDGKEQNMSIFFNGELTDSQGKSGTITPNVDGYSFFAGFSPQTSSDILKGNTRYVFMFQKALSDEAISSLYLNPYQFLEAA